MPPKRKSTGSAAAAATRSQQPRLSFAKGQQTKVTKPTTAVQDAKANLSSTKTKKASQIEKAIEVKDLSAPRDVDEVASPTPETADPLTDNKASRTEDVLGGRAEQDTAGATDGPLGSGWVGDEEVRARKTPQKQINAYWAEKEQARKAPRVHQQDLSLSEKILREWDMSGQYGPCIGIARLKRWKRANTLGLNPPIEVLAVLLQGTDGKDSAKMQRSHVDELLASRVVEV